MNITHAIKMDFNKRGICPRIEAVQGDSLTRVVEISLYENGVAWDVPEEASVLLRFCKPDGTGGLYDTLPDGSTAWSAQGNAVRFALAPQVLAVPGLVQAQLEIVKGDATVGSFTFHIMVEPDPSGGTMISEDYVSWNAWAEKALNEKLQKAFVSYDMFGAYLDGIHDDTQAIINAHSYANRHGLPVVQHRGKIYLKTATEGNCPIIKTDTDLSGTTLIFNENMGRNIILKAEPDDAIRKHTLNGDEIAQLTKGTINIPFLADYKNCICHFKTDISIGKRLNKTEEYVYHETVTVDRYGNLLDGELFRAMTDATAVEMEYQSILERPITISGISIVLDTKDDAQIPCILVKRSNVTLKNFTMRITAQTCENSTAYKGEAVRIENCYNTQVSHFSGENFGTFYDSDFAPKTQTCYALYISGVSRFSLRDCLLIRAWGTIQSQYSKGCVFADSTLGRVDNHYGCRDYTVDNCLITSSQGVINIGYGDGQFVVNNTKFIKFQDPDTQFVADCIKLRPEFCALFSGNIVVTNVTVNNYTGQEVHLLSGGYTENYDFGDSSLILPLAFPDVRISGVVCNDPNDNVKIVNFNVEKDSYAVTNNLPITAKLVVIEDVKMESSKNPHFRVTVDYNYLDNVTMTYRQGLICKIPFKCDFIFDVSCDAQVVDSHINNFNGKAGSTLRLNNCYVYSNATSWQYVRDLELDGCHVYIGSSGTVKFNSNHSFKCVDTKFEERVVGTKFSGFDIPELYMFRNCYCLNEIPDDLSNMLYDANTMVANAGVVKSADLTASDYVQWSYDELSAGTQKEFDWTKYLLLVITTGNYSNIYESTVVPTEIFAGTNNTSRPILCWGSANCHVYQTSDTTIFADCTNISANQRLRVYGVIKT